MTVKARLRQLAQETERIVAAGGYTLPDGRRVALARAIAEARAGTLMYGPGPVPALPAGDRGAPAAVEVSGESTLAAARRLLRAGRQRVTVLNFASARNPGGGFLNGAQAQEEALCRASALHSCLLQVPQYYQAHRADGSPFYSNRVIHSPGVPVFRDDAGQLLAEPFRVDVLTAAAPNAAVVARAAPEQRRNIPAVLRARAARVLQTAAVTGARRLVLGAWGCGVLRNDPAEVARTFTEQLSEDGPFARHFDTVAFAVLDTRPGAPVRSAFAAALGGA